MDIYNLIDLNLGFITNIRGPQLLIIILVILLRPAGIFGAGGSGSETMPIGKREGEVLRFRAFAYEQLAILIRVHCQPPHVHSRIKVPPPGVHRL